jgi:OOP family OmpA-OmpF porin
MIIYFLENIMFKKQLLTLAVLASIASIPLAQADELAPVVNQPANALPPVEESAVAPEASSSTSLTDKRWYVAPFGTFLATGSSVNNGWGGGLAIGKMLDKHFNVELKGFYQTASGYEGWGPTTVVGGVPYQQITNSGSVNMAGGSVDLQYYFMREKFSPYTVVSLGGMNTSGPGFSRNGLITEGGLGFTYELTDNLLVRSDVRYRYTANFAAPSLNADQNDMVVNLGFVVPIGPKPKAEAYVPPAPVAEPVVDCSTLDSDADGVNDCIDKCPGTMAGSKVDATGCPISLELKGVNFEYNSAKLTQNAMFVLDGVAQSLISYPVKDELEVHGHTSSEGSNAYNMKLSQKRSQSVANYLASKGVTNRLVARGYGESQPIADNRTEQGKEQNRRVELIWMGH